MIQLSPMNMDSVLTSRIIRLWF